MKLKDEKINLYQTFISGAIVNKLHSSWMPFSTNIQRRKGHVTLSDLKRFIRIEDEIWTHTKNELLAKQKASANMVATKSEKDTSSSSNNNNNKLFNKKKNQNPNNLNVQKKEFNKSSKCFNYRKQ
ncbi:probable DNA replication complex GINS protein PSF3 [Asparagus officinalis]|uniref:probable DNA replication complex GINS protein PSF3 n=1 Tax=Asparagus officinalis TaxID=4686 RepID=UPI00098E59FA|nr:probable DNA replication complex GINS protein PSF3 [Asparagus officinalis]